MATDSLDRGRELLLRARKLAPHSAVIAHSLAELNAKAASLAKSPLEKSKLRADARSLSRDLLAREGAGSHPHHTLLKIATEELSEILAENNDQSALGAVNALEALLTTAKQEFPDDPFLLDAEAKVSGVLNQHPRALDAMRKAFNINPTSTYVASRLAALHKAGGNLPAAIDVLKRSVEANPNDKETRFALGMALIEADAEILDCLYQLRLAFTAGDARYCM